jgi:hypothetical protein
VSKINEPVYEILHKLPLSSVEVRRYDKMVFIVTTIESDKRSVAARQSFSTLLSYIDGHNKDANGNSLKIEMTAPVMQRMLAPNLWQSAFVLPTRFKIDQVPTPLSEHVHVLESPENSYAVIRFSGRTTTSRLAEQEAKLREISSAQQWHILSTPIYAFYNRPWTLPFLKRNEIMFLIE